MVLFLLLLAGVARAILPGIHYRGVARGHVWVAVSSGFSLGAVFVFAVLNIVKGIVLGLDASDMVIAYAAGWAAGTGLALHPLMRGR